MYILLKHDKSLKFDILDTEDNSIETIDINIVKALADKNISLYVCTSYSDFKLYQIKELLLNPMILYNFIAVSPVDSTNRTFISLDGTKTYQWGNSKGLPENLLKEWNYEKNGDLNPLKLTSGSGRKVWWKCFKHHEWQAVIDDRVRLKEGCPYCSGHRVLKGYNDLLTINPQIASEWHPIKNKNLKDGNNRDISTPDKVTANSNKKVWWLCDNNHSYKSSIIHRNRNGIGCPYCSASDTEKQVYEILKSLSINFEIEKMFINNTMIGKCKFDIYIPSINILIELDDKEHFYNSSSDRRIKSHERDNAKNIFCLKNNVPILRIPYEFISDENIDILEYLIKDFYNTQIVPYIIIRFYADYKFSNYAEVATKLNEYVKSKQNAALAVV